MTEFKTTLLKTFEDLSKLSEKGLTPGELCDLTLALTGMIERIPYQLAQSNDNDTEMEKFLTYSKGLNHVIEHLNALRDDRAEDLQKKAH